MQPPLRGGIAFTLSCHPLIFTCRVGGRGRCLHVRKGDGALMRRATENCRRLEALLAEEGVRLVESLREPGAD